MSPPPGTVAPPPERVVIVLAGGRGSRLDVLARWARRLLPAAVLVVAPAAPPAVPDGATVVTVNAEDVESGPLSLAAALIRDRRKDVTPSASRP